MKEKVKCMLKCIKKDSFTVNIRHILYGRELFNYWYHNPSITLEIAHFHATIIVNDNKI